MRLTRYGVIYERGFLVRKPLQMIPSNRNRAVELFEPLNSSAEAIVKTYEAEMGANVYALFNALTDFASRPPGLRDFRRAEHSMQTQAGCGSSMNCSRRTQNRISRSISVNTAKSPIGTETNQQPL